MAFNPKRTKNFRQYLRNNVTETEVILWSRLKGKQLLGYKIRRQYGVGKYAIDFYCPQLKLGIEIDGESHLNRKELLMIGNAMIISLNKVLKYYVLLQSKSKKI